MSSSRPLLPIAILAIALIAPAGAAALERSVSVSATATLKVPNDSAGIGISVSPERRGRGAALRTASHQLKSVISAVGRIPGVGAGDVRTGRISVRPTKRGEHLIYRAVEGIGVTLHDPGEAGKLIAAAIDAGASEISGPHYFVGDIEAATAKALAAAFAKAKARAGVLAEQAGATLGEAISISEGEGQFISAGPEAAGKGGEFTGSFFGECGAGAHTANRRGSACSTPPPTKPGTSTVSAIVHVVFALQ